MNGCRIRIMAGAIMVLLLGCTQDDGPLGVHDGGRDDRAVRADLSCTVAVRAGTLQCNTLSASLPAGVSGAQIGGQGVYLALEASSVEYTDAGATGTFTAEVTVRNFLTQTLGVIDDGGTVRVDPDGIRVFFLGGHHVVDGTGTISLDENTPQATFTATDQYYFQYDQALSPGQRSLPEVWVWKTTGEVNTFTFTVAVSARVLDEGEIEPGVKFQARTFSAGGAHTCGLTLAGAAYCWGNGNDGRLGDGSEDQASTPQPVSGGLEFAVVTTGRNFSCALTLAGAAYCWGADAFGQLGNGDPLDQSLEPDAVAGGLVFHTLSSGVAHSCGLTTSGAAYCWGKTGLGRLGNFAATANPQASAPVAVEAAGLTFATISAGGQHTCALTDAGVAYCWGSAGYGQLGNGFANGDSTVQQAVPALVHDPDDGPVTYAAISTGGAHTCALTTDGVVYCWGWNSAGQAGNDTAEYIVKPARVYDPDDGPVTFTAISAGGTHACALATDGTAYCWGWNLYGQVGNGDEEKKAQPRPAPVYGGLRFVSIDAGDLHTCGVTSSGDAYCWGNGGVGRLGNGVDHEDRFAPEPVANITNFALLDDVVPAALLATRLDPSPQPVARALRRTTFEAFASAPSGGTARRGQTSHGVDYYRAG